MKRFDVAIAGGGLIGGAIALALARAGAKVTILDASRPGREASWAGAGILSAAPDNPEMMPLVPLALASLRRYSDFVKQIEEMTGEDVGFRPYGLLEMFPHENTRELGRVIAARRHLGLNEEALSSEQAREVEPSLSAEAGAAILRPDDASVDNRTLAGAVLEAARRIGVTIYEDAPALSILREGGRAHGLTTKTERIEARWTVIAAGSFSAGIEGAEQYAPVIPAKGQMAAVRCAGAAIRRVLISEEVYLVPRNDGRILVGATVERVGFDRTVNAEVTQKLLEAAISLVPALKDHEVVETWIGLRPDSPDHLPMLGPTDVEGLIIATGHFRNGILLAPITAKLVCDWIQTQRTSTEFERFSPMRFQKTPKSSMADA